MKQTKRKIILLLFIVNCSLQIAVAQPTQEWVARYESPTGSSAIPNKMCLDKVGNCYVFGEYFDITNNVILIKYNTSGDTLWTRKFQNSVNSLPKGVISDSIGNSYITFLNGPDFGPYNIVTIKFNPQRVQQWLKIYDSGGNDQPTDIIMDRYNNVYVAGVSGDESLVIKYNPIGDTIWTRKYTESGFRFPVTSIDIDTKNNVHIGGLKGNISNGTQNFYVIKYDSNGVFKWLNYHSTNGVEVLNKIKVDNNFNLYATGRSINGKLLTVKYDSTGSQQWMVIYEGPGPAGGSATDMGIDNFGNIIITGYSNAIGTGTYDYVTVKYNTFGDSLWVKRYNGNQNNNDEAYSLVLDNLNNTYITGRSRSTGETWNYATVKYDENGNEKWVAIYNGPAGNGEDIAYKINIDQNYNVFITGISDRGSFNYDYATIKYSQTVGILPISETAPLQYSLSQNYPNPFNP
ncbi:MAG: hypothetical protein HOP31_17180, partial [Ignavibacteria bacterium]|nr:hypothetical protein [Ignavibacteria bacterium]